MPDQYRDDTQSDVELEMLSKPTQRRVPPHDVALSVDLGNGFTKFSRGQFTSPTLDLDCSSFPSFASREGGDASIEQTSGLKSLDLVTVMVDGLGYRVGPDALNAASGNASRNITQSFYGSTEYIALFRGALAYMDLPEEVTTISMLGFGLPLTVFSNQKVKQDVLNKIRGTHVIPNLRRGGTREITVERIALQPQLAGSLLAMAVEGKVMKDVSDGTNLVIDVGYGTLLWLVTSGLKPQVNRSGGNRGGVASLLKAWANSVDPDLGNNPHVLARIDDALARSDSTIRIGGETIQIEAHMSALQDQVRINLREMEESIGSMASIDNIFLVGGGSYLYRDAVQGLCGTRVLRTPKGNPQFTNLAGFQLLAQNMLTQIGDHE